MQVGCYVARRSLTTYRAAPEILVRCAPTTLSTPVAPAFASQSIAAHSPIFTVQSEDVGDLNSSVLGMPSVFQDSGDFSGGLFVSDLVKALTGEFGFSKRAWLYEEDTTSG